MTNSGKALIIGLLVVDLGVGGYLLFPKDERPPAAVGTVTGGATTTAGSNSVDVETGKAAAGNVVQMTPPVSGTNQLAVAPPPAPVTAAPAAPAAPATVAPAAPAIAPAVTAQPVLGGKPGSVNSAQQAGQKPRTFTGKITSAQVPPSPARPKPKSVPHVEQVVRGNKHDQPQRRGSNQVSAAITEQLVKESSKPDPSLPLPPNSYKSPPGKSSNPVAAAMTDQLVRESSRVDPASSAQFSKH
jgi:hypothetical protein